MKFGEVAAIVRGVPFIAPENARLLYDAVITGNRRRVLELGFAHGAATCVMAAALEELGGGELVAVDLEAARSWQSPSAEELLDRAGLRQYVTLIRETTSYTWHLRNELRRCIDGGRELPSYDLCIIDGPKNWTVDGAAFLMADRLLKPGALVILDDVDWTYATADRLRDATDGITHRVLSDSERSTAHIREVAELLVMQHPGYGDFVFTNTDWFLATKLASSAPVSRAVQYRVVKRPSDVIRERALGLMRAVRHAPANV